MKKIVNCYLNVRIGNPNLAAPCVEYLAPGMTVDVMEAAAGSMIDGNNTWYRDNANNYYWSGGFQNDQFISHLTDHLKKNSTTQFLTEESAAHLKSITGVKGIGWSMDNDVFYVCIYYSGQTPELVPAQVMVQAGFNDVASVPVQLHPTTSFTAHTNVLPSAFIKNKIPLKGSDDKENTGSLGCFVKVNNQNKVMGITCYHVVRSNWNDFDIKDGTINRSFNITLLNGQPDIATIIDGGIDDKTDAALISFFDQVDIDTRIPIIGKVLKPKDLTDVDVNKKTPVRMFGAQSGFKEGVVAAIMKEASINYGFVNKTLHDLIVIKNAAGPFSAGGDSGSIVVDNTNAAIGIVVGGDETRTLVVPITRILEKFNAQIPT